MKLLAIALMLGTGAAPVAAQTTAAPARSGLGGLLGGALPGLGSAGMGNAAGLLGYCIKNNVLGGANAGSVLGKLTGKPGVTNSPGFLAGQQGQVQTGAGQGFSLAGVKDRVKTQVCSQVPKRASSFL